MISYDRSKSLQFDRLWHIIEIFQYASTGSSHDRFCYFSFLKLHNFLWHPVIGVKGSDVWSPTFFIDCVISESLICVSTCVSALKSFCCPCTQIKIRNISCIFLMITAPGCKYIFYMNALYSFSCYNSSIQIAAGYIVTSTCSNQLFIDNFFIFQYIDESIGNKLTQIIFFEIEMWKSRLSLKVLTTFRIHN